MNIYSLYKHVKISYSCCEEVSTCIVSVIFIRQLKMSLNEQRIFEINITAKRLFKNAMKSDVGWPHGAAGHHQILCQIWEKKDQNETNGGRNRKNIEFVWDHLSTNDTSEFLLERAIVPFNQTVNAAKISQVNQKLQCYTKIVPTTQHQTRLCNLYMQCT